MPHSAARGFVSRANIVTFIGAMLLIALAILIPTMASSTDGPGTGAAVTGPNLTLTKAADVSEATEGETVTYTLTYANTGGAAATGTVLGETIGEATSFVSCSDNCAVEGSSVSWNLGELAAGASDSVTWTVTVTSETACDICNVATIGASNFNDGQVVESNKVCLEVVHVAHPERAHSNGSGIGAQVLTTGLIGISTTPIGKSASSQPGIGTTSDEDKLLAIDLPAIVKTEAVGTSSFSKVSGNTDTAVQTSTARVDKLCLLKIGLVCTVAAKTAQAVANTIATGEYASHSSTGSMIEGLKINGVPVAVKLGQTTKIALDPLVFGKGSYVAINERKGSVSWPAGGTWSADQTTTMIHLKVTGVLGLQGVEVVVAQATAHSDFPNIASCHTASRKVSGHAFVASADLKPSIIDAMEGHVAIPPTGGWASQEVAGVLLPKNLLIAGVGGSRSKGVRTATAADATSGAELAGDTQGGPVCVVKLSNGDCIAEATAIRAQARAHAEDGSAWASDKGTTFLNLTVLGVPIVANPAPNTTIELPGLGYIVINEQFCDNGTAKFTSGTGCSGTKSAGLTVRGLHVVLTVGELAGADVIVSEAHADARFIPSAEPTPVA